MKQLHPKLWKAAKKSFVIGAVICVCFYTIIRLMFWNFDFDLKEELGNLFQVVCKGGSMFSIAAMLFLLIEKVIIHFSALKRSA